MKGDISKVEQKPSKFGGHFYHVFFKMESGKSARSCIYPNCRNYQRWASVISRAIKGEAVTLSGLNIKSADLVDADSQFSVVNNQPATPGSTIRYF